MKNLLYLFAVATVFFWAVAYFKYDASPMIHFLLLLALFLVLLRLVRNK